jgi:hypothetical protein
MKMLARFEVVNELQEAYAVGNRSEKSRILDQICGVTGTSRLRD